MEELFADVQRATFPALMTFYNLFQMNMQAHDWAVTAYGSVVAQGSGRDIDFMFVQRSGSDWPVERVIEWLATWLDIRGTYGEAGWQGVIGVAHNHAIDITLVSHA